MTQDDIIKMAKEYADEVTNGYGVVYYEFDLYGLEKFALLLTATEREEWERVNMNDHKEGDLGIGAVKWDASAPLVMHPHPAFQATQSQPDLSQVGEVGVWGERQWQGLTEEQVKQIEMSASSTLSAIYLAEAQLKGKNT